MTNELALKGQVYDYQADRGHKSLSGRGSDTPKDIKQCRGCGERFRAAEAYGVWSMNDRLRYFDLMLKPKEPKEVFQQRSSVRQSLSRRITPVGG